MAHGCANLVVYTPCANACEPGIPEAMPINGSWLHEAFCEEPVRQFMCMDHCPQGGVKTCSAFLHGFIPDYKYGGWRFLASCPVLSPASVSSGLSWLVLSCSWRLVLHCLALSLVSDVGVGGGEIAKDRMQNLFNLAAGQFEAAIAPV